MINEVIIVEGKNDKKRILSIYPDAYVLITDGSSVNEHLAFFKEVALRHDLILFLDPDFPGEKIRKTIMSLIPNSKNAFLKKELAISKNNKKVGIEHASKKDIIEALNSVISINTNKKNLINSIDLYNLGLIGNNNSKLLRKKISDYYNIGCPNGKTFLERINMLDIKKDDLKKIIELN